MYRSADLINRSADVIGLQMYRSVDVIDRSAHSAVAAQQLTSRFSQLHCCWPNSFSVMLVLPLALNLVLSTPFTYLLDCMKESPRLKLVTGQVENRPTTHSKSDFH